MCAMNARVVRGRVLAHQLHRGPILLPFVRVEIEPAEVLHGTRQFLVPSHGQLAVVIADRRARAAAAAVAEQREIAPRLQRQPRLDNLQLAELDEMVAAPARSKLAPGLVFVVARNGRRRSSPRPTRRGRRLFVNFAPMPNRVSSWIAFLSRSGSASSVFKGRSSTVIFMRQAMSTPTAYGITAFSVASTPPMGSP